MNESPEVNVSENSFESINKSNKKILIFVALFVLIVLLVVVILIVVSNTPAKRLQRQLELGTRYLEELNYEKAIAAFEAAIEIDSKNLKAYEGHVSAYVGEGDVDGIYGVYDNLDPDAFELIRQASVDGVNGIISNLVADGDYEKALSTAKSLSHIDESTSNAAVVGVVESNPSALLDALESSDDFSEVADVKGLILVGNGQYDEAYDYYESRIISNPEATFSYLGIASTYLGRDDVIGALEALERGIGTGADEYVIRSAEDYIRQNSITISGHGTLIDYHYDFGDSEHCTFGEIINTYDEAGNLVVIDEIREDGYSRHSELDTNGNYVYEIHSFKNGSYMFFNWSYNEHGDRIATHYENHPYGGDADSVMDSFITYEYDSEGRIVTENSSGYDTYQKFYEYDENGDLIKVTHIQDGETRVESYTYDEFGRIIESLDHVSNHFIYEYDDRGNEIYSMLNGSIPYRSEYDLMNNRIGYLIKPESELGGYEESFVYEYHFIGDVMGVVAQ